MELIFQEPNKEAVAITTNDPLKEIHSFFDGSLPLSVKFYDGEPSDETEIKVRTANDIQSIINIKKLYIIQYPEYQRIVAFIIKTLVTLAINAILAPKSPDTSLRNRSQESANEALGKRTNDPRLGGADPFCVGEVLSVPDLLMTYNVFEDHQEIEVSYLLVTHGEVDANQLKDGKTRLEELGANAEIYPPYTTQGHGAPQLIIGSAITKSIMKSRRTSAVNGQTLVAPNDGSYRANANIAFDSGGNIAIHADGYRSSFGAPQPIKVDLRGMFQVGDTINVITAPYTTEIFDNANPPVSQGNQTVNLSGAYEVVSFSDITYPYTDPGDNSVSQIYSHTLVKLKNPEIANTDWNLIKNYVGDKTGLLSPTLSRHKQINIGIFRTDLIGTTQIVVNFIATNGLYKDNGRAQYKENVTIRVFCQSLSDDGAKKGAEKITDVVIEGSSVTTGTRSKTAYITVPESRYIDVRAERTSNKDTGFEGSVVDEIKWRDLMAFADPKKDHYGNATTMLLESKATENALRGKNRQANLKIVSKMPIYRNDAFLPKAPTKDFADIIVAITLDKRYGSRGIETLDLDSLYSARDEIKIYFGTDDTIQFNFTFSSSNTTYEEMIEMACTACFCEAFRINGDKIQFRFDRERTVPKMLFNNSNKIAGTETRKIEFGYDKDHDGVEFKWKNPKTDDFEVISLPEDTLLLHPNKIDIAGITTKAQAHFHAWRAWNRLRYHNQSLEVTVNDEANLLARKDYVLIANNQKPEINDGEIIRQNGLLLTLSSPVSLAGTLVIQLQLSDATVDILGCIVVDKYHITIERAPKKALVTDVNAYAKTSYQILEEGNKDISDFMMIDKRPSGKNITISAINYDRRYFSNDKDHIKGLI